MKSKNKTVKTPSTATQSVWPAMTLAESVASYKKTLPKPSDSRNDITEKFLMIAEGVLSSKRSFALADFIYECCSVYGLPALEVRTHFQKLTDYLCRIGKLTEIRGCYEENVFAVNV